MSKKSVMVWAWVVGAKGQFNESYPTSTVGLHIAKRQLRDRKNVETVVSQYIFGPSLGD
jgi:hypothetical protein